MCQLALSSCDAGISDVEVDTDEGRLRGCRMLGVRVARRDQPSAPVAADRMRSGRTALDRHFLIELESSTYMLTLIRHQDYSGKVRKKSMILVDDCPA
jgi:hypothetical protein